MSQSMPLLRSGFVYGIWILVSMLAVGCFSTRGIEEIETQPFPEIYQDDSTIRFSGVDNKVFIEVRRTEISGPLGNLAVHYSTLFPGGEPVRLGDKETYLKIKGHTAYRVVFSETYIRRQKRTPKDTDPEDIPPGWTLETIPDPQTGKPISALRGPVIPRFKTVYLVEGKKFLYYIFMRADGDAIENARKALDKFVRSGIDYR